MFSTKNAIYLQNEKLKGGIRVYCDADPETIIAIYQARGQPLSPETQTLVRLYIAGVNAAYEQGRQDCKANT